MSQEGRHPRQLTTSVPWMELESFQAPAQKVSAYPVTACDASFPAHTFASRLISTDNSLVVVFAQFLINLSSHPDLCVNMQETGQCANL